MKNDVLDPTDDIDTADLREAVYHYLRHCGGSDQFIFETDGRPDAIKARRFAEALRKQLRPLGDEIPDIVQRVNIVRLSVPV
jgi:hypothetical protein